MLWKSAIRIAPSSLQCYNCDVFCIIQMLLTKGLHASAFLVWGAFMFETWVSIFILPSYWNNNHLHLVYTSSLVYLQLFEFNQSSLLHSLFCPQRQAPGGGFQGRTNKDSDTCYAFWWDNQLCSGWLFICFSHECDVFLQGWWGFEDLRSSPLHWSGFSTCIFAYLSVQGASSSLSLSSFCRANYWTPFCIKILFGRTQEKKIIIRIRRRRIKKGW